MELSKKDIADMMLSNSTKKVEEIIKEELKKTIFEPLSDGCLSLFKIIIDNNLKHQINFLKQYLFGESDVSGYRIFSRMSGKDALELALVLKPSAVNDIIVDKDIAVSDIKHIVLKNESFLNEVFYSFLPNIIVENEQDLSTLKKWIHQTFQKNNIKCNDSFNNTYLKQLLFSRASLCTIPVDTDLWDRPFYKELVVYSIHILQEHFLKHEGRVPNIYLTNRFFEINIVSKRFVFPFVNRRHLLKYPNNYTLESIKEEINTLIQLEVPIQTIKKPQPRFSKNKDVSEYINSYFKQNMDKIVTPYFTNNNNRAISNFITINDFKRAFTDTMPDYPVFKSIFSNKYTEESFKKIKLFYSKSSLKDRLKEGDSSVILEFREVDIFNECKALLSSGYKLKNSLFAELHSVFKLRYTIGSKTTNRWEDDFIIFSYPELYTKEDFFEILKKYVEIQDRKCLDINKILFYFSGDLLEEVVREFNLKYIFFGSFGTRNSYTSEFGFEEYSSVYGRYVYHEGMRFSKELAKEIGMVFFTEDI